MSLSGFVVFEGIQQERGTLLYHVHLHEHIHRLVGWGGEGVMEEGEKVEG